MVSKSKKTADKRRTVKLGKLKVNKETVKNLTAGEVKRVKGGGMGDLCKATTSCGVHIPKTIIN